MKSFVIFFLPALAALLFTVAVWTGRDIPAGPLPQPAVPGIKMAPVPVGLPDSLLARNARPENPNPPAVESAPSSAVEDSVTEDNSQAWERAGIPRSTKEVEPVEESAGPALPRGLPAPVMIAIPGTLEIQLEVVGGSLGQLLRVNSGLWKMEGVYKRFGSHASPSCQELDEYVIDGQFFEFQNLKSQKWPFLLPAGLTRRILGAVQEKLEKDKAGAYVKAVVRLTAGGKVKAVVLEAAGR